MELGCSQIVLNVSDLGQSYDFYIRKLGFPVIEEDEARMFAFRAGGVRYSVFGGGRALDVERDPANVNLMFRTDNIDQTVAELKEKGVSFFGGVESGSFMRQVAFADPDNNLLYLAQYGRDPLRATS